MSLNLVQVAVGVCNDRRKLQLHILGLHIQRKGVREALGLASLNGEVVLHGSEVADDALVGGSSRGELLGDGEDAGQEGELDGTIFFVGNFDEGLCRAAVDEAHAEDVGVGEGGFEVGGELGLLAAVGDGGVGL